MRAGWFEAMVAVSGALCRLWGLHEPTMQEMCS